MALIYIVEDDKSIQEIEEYALKSNGYDVRCFDRAESFYEGLTDALPDLVLLDIMLPGEDGICVLKRIRSAAASVRLPVVMVTAKASEIDTVKGLDAGADDYIAKPFGIMELISRVRAVLRRTKPETETPLSFAEIALDEKRHVCTVGAGVIPLTYKEYELLKLFITNAGTVLTRELIMDIVWETEFTGESRTVDMHVNSLRRKLGAGGEHIITVRNVGYKLE